MSKMIQYYHVVSLSKDPAYAAKVWMGGRWRAEVPDGELIEHVAKGLWPQLRCNGCNRLKPERQPIDIVIEERPDAAPLNYINGPVIGMLRSDFIDDIGRSLVCEHLYLGKLLDCSGKIIPGYETYVGKYQNTIRGNGRSQLRRCSTCRRLLYAAMGAPYLVAGEVKDVAISECTGLIVREEVLDRINLSRWKKLGIEELPLLKEPLDGYPTILESWSGERCNLES